MTGNVHYFDVGGVYADKNVSGCTLMFSMLMSICGTLIKGKKKKVLSGLCPLTYCLHLCALTSLGALLIVCEHGCNSLTVTWTLLVLVSISGCHGDLGMCSWY